MRKFRIDNEDDNKEWDRVSEMGFNDGFDNIKNNPFDENDWRHEAYWDGWENGRG